jgi:hypothetical protein
MGMGQSKNTLNTTLKKMDRLDKVIACNVLTIITLACVSLVISCRQFGQPNSSKDVLGLINMRSQSRHN